MKLRYKMLIYYLILTILTMTVTALAYREINNRILVSKVAQMSEESNQLIRENVLLTFDTINNYSKMLLSNELIQRILLPTHEVDLTARRQVNLYLLEFLDSVPLISSIYVYDLEGNQYSSNRDGIRSIPFHDIKQSGLLDQALELKGSAFISLNMNQLLTLRSGDNLVSYVRVINSTNTMEPMGLLVINVAGHHILPYFDRVGSSAVNGLEIWNEDGQIVSSFGEPKGLTDYLEGYGSGYDQEGYPIMQHEGMNYLVSRTTIEKVGWSIVSTTPFSEISEENDRYTVITLGLVLVNLLFLLGGSFLISRTITVPIGNLVQSMRKVIKGKFVPVNFKSSSYEMTVLKDGYNLMIDQIQMLIERVIDEQKKLRKAELDMIQAQIKPHFLYNAFDAISSLSFSGKSDDVYSMVKALGTYYRNSLGDGKEVITLKKELDIITSYIAIQNIRYRNLVDLQLEVNQKYLGVPILKLILQPLVENALYHGIKPKDEHGYIKVTVVVQEEVLVIRVEDNGVGMSPERLEIVRSGKANENQQTMDGGFGLRSTMERLTLYYDTPNLVTIDSRLGEGTTVTLRIPLDRV